MKLILEHFKKNPKLAELPLCMHNNLVILFPMSLRVCVSLLILLSLGCQIPFMEVFL